MKLIHCSDIHLDSKMESNLSFKQAAERNNEICATFSRMVDYAKAHDVDVILIAGDLFDTDRVTAKTADYIFAVIEQAKGIDFLYLRGNHDESRRVFSGRALPKNMKTFSERWHSYHYLPLTVTGAELTDDNAFSLYDSLSLNPNEINIVTLHGQTAGQRGRGLISLPDLRGKHIDYLALGHLHSFQLEPLDSRGNYCYCGCLEGRGFDECGEKGFVLLDINEKQLRHTFVPFAARTLHNIPVDISGLTTVSELAAAMKSSSSKISPSDLVKFTWQGACTTDTQKDFPFLLKLMESWFYFTKIKDESRLLIEKGTYGYDISLKGEFIRMVLGSKLNDEEKEQIICWGIQALKGEEIKI